MKGVDKLKCCFLLKKIKLHDFNAEWLVIEIVFGPDDITGFLIFS